MARRFYLLAIPLFAFASSVLAQGVHDPSVNYVSAGDSPFSSTGFGYFHLENFEDGQLNTPGASHIGGAVLQRSDVYSDSVDADDGVVDNNGNTAGATTGALYSLNVNSVEFRFDAAALSGQLPTHVGLVVTDALRDTGVTLSAFRNGQLLGSISGTQVAELQHFTAQDRFYGWVDTLGIDRVVVTAAATDDWALDHLQYGTVSTPGSQCQIEPIAGIDGLIGAIEQLDLDTSTTSALIEKLQEAEEKYLAGDLEKARRRVYFFIVEVEAAVADGALSTADANMLLDGAAAVLAGMRF